MNKILIRGLEIPACHGVHAEEKKNMQPFIFDVDIDCDFSEAAKSDNLQRTVNYSAACQLIHGITTHNNFNLIETLATECAFALLDNDLVTAVKVDVYKPQAPVKLPFKTVGVSVGYEKSRAFLSLGSSLGDKKKYLDAGIEKLSLTRGIKVVKVSDYFASAPVGGVAQNEFLNCAAEIETYLPPRALLRETSRIEDECGRVRNVKWGDRTLDIDIVFYGDKVIREEGLLIPHPYCLERDFVMRPLKQIAPEFVVPVVNKQLKNL